MLLRLPQVFSLKEINWLFPCWSIVTANVLWTLQFTSSGRETTWFYNSGKQQKKICRCNFLWECQKSLYYESFL